VVIAIVDYGAGNLRSVSKAIERVGYQATITDRTEDVERADTIILPGVGAAADTMHNLNERNLAGPVVDAIKNGKPFLGICMGLQALMTGSEEGGWQQCLDIVSGVVRRLPPGIVVPHMGWNQVWQARQHPIFRDIRDGAEFYFVHSFVCDPEDPSVVIGQTEYQISFPSIIARDSFVATQFHPEKSGDDGLRLYENFLAWAGERPTRSVARSA
jgi:imidazole glycerol-phosphate synthase subunit HisH